MPFYISIRESWGPAAALAATGLLWLCACSKAPASVGRSEPEAVRRVAIAPVVELRSEETVYATGRLAAQDRAVLSVKVPGRLESIAVDLGSKVKRGDNLAQIEKIDFELRKRQAEAALSQARARLGLSLTGEDDKAQPETASIVKEARAVLVEASKNRDRIVRLQEQGILAEAEAETVESAFLVATNRYEEAVHEAKNRMAVLKQRQAELAMAEQQLADTRIVASFDGVVEQRQSSPGEFLREGTPVLTLVRIDPIRLRAEVAEKDAPKLKLGQKVHLTLEGSDEIHTSTVSRLSPVIAENSRMLVAEADFQNSAGDLRPGSFAKVEIVVDAQRTGLFVPRSSVVTFAGMQKVFSINEGKAVERAVSCGRVKGDNIEILSGVKPGERVIIAPGDLRSGQPVEVGSRET